MTDDTPQDPPAAPAGDPPPAAARQDEAVEEFYDGDVPGTASGDGPSGGGPPGDAPFSLAGLRTLFRLMDRFDVGEVSLRNGEERWHVRRGAQAVSAPAYASPAPPAAPAASSPAAASAEPPAAAAKPAADGVTIDSPTVGTFYEAASPEDPPLARVGDHVAPDTVVCLVEAMKVFNQIEAEVAGVIEEVLVKNGEAVEYGQPLFRITPG